VVIGDERKFFAVGAVKTTGNEIKTKVKMEKNCILILIQMVLDLFPVINLVPCWRSLESSMPRLMREFRTFLYSSRYALCDGNCSLVVGFRQPWSPAYQWRLPHPVIDTMEILLLVDSHLLLIASSNLLHAQILFGR